MKRYLLFAGMNYYAAGGWDDFRGDFDSVAEAVAFESRIDTHTYRGDWWWHVIDTTTGTKAASGDDSGRPQREA